MKKVLNMIGYCQLTVRLKLHSSVIENDEKPAIKFTFNSKEITE